MTNKRKVSTLHNWEENPRDLTESDYHRLKRQLRLGEYKPLLCLTDGTVLGGNMRLKAYKELKIDSVWVSEIEPVDTGDGWKAIINGEEANKIFDSREQLILEYALSDNDRVGTWNDVNLADELSKVNIDPDLFKVDLALPTRIEDLQMAFGVGADGIETGQKMMGRDFDQNDMANKLETYEFGTVKQIVIYFDNNQYLDVMERIQTMLKKTGSQNNTELFLEALKALEAHYEA